MFLTDDAFENSEQIESLLVKNRITKVIGDKKYEFTNQAELRSTHRP